MNAERIARALGTDIVRVERLGDSSGGAIEHWRATGPTRTYFVKSGGTEVVEEATALGALNQAGACTPRVLYAGDDLLVLKWIETEVPMPAFWAGLGRDLATQHRVPQSAFGFSLDNHLGGTPQANPVETGDWAEYFWRNRLRPMIDATGWTAPGLREVVLTRLSDVDEAPSLVHGDLWNGNILCGPHQRAYLIDPAPYRGHREVDLAMTELFGGFGPKFYTAYDEVFPRRDGYARRRSIYNLYHLLNHWRLFGLSYRIACEAALLQIMRE